VALLRSGSQYQDASLARVAWVDSAMQGDMVSDRSRPPNAGSLVIWGCYASYWDFARFITAK
jgi:hypothetical protein